MSQTEVASSSINNEIEASIKPKSPIIRVCNLSGSVTEKIARQLLENISPLEEFVMYPKDKAIPTATKVVYARFIDPDAYKCAIHLTSSLLLDRPLIVVPMSSDKIPSEVSAINTATQLSAVEVSQLVVGGALVGSNINIALNFGFPYVPIPPELPHDYSVRRQNEVRRTIFVHNIHEDVSAEILLTLFSGVGEVRYVRLFDSRNSTKKCAYIEFTESTTVYPALQFHEFPLFETPIYVTFAKISINKEPETYSVSTRSRRSRTPPKKSERHITRRSKSRSPSHRRDVSRRRHRETESVERKSRSRRRSSSVDRNKKRHSNSKSPTHDYYESRKLKKRRRSDSASSDRKRISRKRSKREKSESRKRTRSISSDDRDRHEKHRSSRKDKSKRRHSKHHSASEDVVKRPSEQSPVVDWSEEERIYLESKRSSRSTDKATKTTNQNESSHENNT